MNFENREHKINFLIKNNRERMKKIDEYMRKILENEREIVRLSKERFCNNK